MNARATGGVTPLAWIDALRALAILMVLANHVALVVPGLSAPLEAIARFGQMGVQLFFVASAYTLCLSWQQRQDEPCRTLRFWLRRLFRVGPLYWFGIALFAALGALSGTDHPTASPAEVAANAAFVHGLWPEARNAAVPGGWSIGVEMAFYAVFPWLAAVLLRRASGSVTLLTALVAVALRMAWLDAAGTTVTNNGADYFHPLHQLPVFLVGIALYQWHAAGGALWHARLAALLAATLAAAALALTAALWRSGAAQSFTLVPATSAVAFAALAHLARDVPRWPAILLTLGRGSFAVYVVHTLFAWHLLHALQDTVRLAGDTAYLGALALVTAASHASAIVLGRLVEQPGIDLGRRVVERVTGPRRVATG